MCVSYNTEMHCIIFILPLQLQLESCPWCFFHYWKFSILTPHPPPCNIKNRWHQLQFKFSYWPMSRHAQGTFHNAKKHSLTVMNIFTPIIIQQSSIKKITFRSTSAKRCGTACCMTSISRPARWYTSHTSSLWLHDWKWIIFIHRLRL